MPTIVRTAALALALSAGAAHTQDYYDTKSANFWLPRCRAPYNSAWGRECTAYFQGFDVGMSLSTGARLYCLPPNVSFDQAIRITISFADRNPQYTHMLFGVVIVGALRDAFPCR
jgi:hypothetical protein